MRTALATLFCLSFLLLALAVLTLVQTQSLILWKLTILGTEYGHFFVLACLGSLVALWVGTRVPTAVQASSQDWRISATQLALVLAAGLYLRPLARAAFLAPHLQSELKAAFGGSPILSRPVIGWRVLWGLQNLSERAVVKSVVFARPGGHELSFDQYAPKLRTSALVPWVLVIHGGGWNGGDRKQLPELSDYLANLGYSVFATTYRLAPDSKWPAQREDIESAVRYIKEHHKEFGIDPTRWVVLGRSAGGQLAEAVGYQLHDPGLKGCVSYYAPADMDFAYKFGKEDDVLGSLQLLRDYMGGTPSEKPAAYREASSIQAVTAKTPPTLLLHGKSDTLVWYRQSERLLTQLRAQNVPSSLVSLDWATHGFDYNPGGPGGQLATYAVEHFLSVYLPIKESL